MSIIRRGDKNYFIGLNWRQLYMPKKLQAEVDDLVKTTNLRSPVGVIRRPPKGAAMQPQVGFTEDADADKCFSGASVLANAIERGLLVEKVAGEQYWVVLVLDHSVFPGTDRLYKADSVEEGVRELVGLAGSDDITIYMSDASAENLPMFENFEPLDFLGIIEGSAADPHKRDVRIGKLKKLPIGKVLAMATFLCAAGGAYWFMGAKSAAPVEVAGGFPALAPLTQSAEESAMTEEIRVAARQEEAGWVFQQSQISPSFVMTALSEQFKALPLSVAGWSIKSMKFDAASPTTVTLTYRRESMGTPYGLMIAIPLQWKFAPTADTAVAQATIPASSAEVPGDVIEQLNSRGDRWLDFIDALYSRGFSVEAGQSLETDRPTPIQGLPATSADSFKRQLSVQQRTFNAAGSGWLSANGFGYAVQPLSFIAVKTVEVTLGDGSMNWTMNGEVYEHAE